MKKSAKVMKMLLVPLAAASFLAGCSTDIDDDAFRAGAIQIEIDEVTSDEIYPTAGDEIDWKMLFVPTPGDITVNTFWDDPTGVFNVVVGVYDRFGIPIEVMRRETAADKLEVKAFTPESGLHYIKVQAESGRSIYSMNVKFETNYDGMAALEEAPAYTAYADFETEIAENKKAEKGGKGGSKVSEGSAAAPAAPAGAVALPTAAAGGAVVLPSAAAGGISGGSAQSGPTVVRSSGGGGYGSGEVKTLKQKTSAVTTTTSEVEDICPDLRGKYTTLNAEMMMVSKKGKVTQIKVNVGSAHGVTKGAIGEIYVDGKRLEGGRFKITKVFESNALGETNAPTKSVKQASKIVVKIPD